MASSCTFSKAWQMLKTKVEEGKTSWGKNELKNLMFECLHEGAQEADKDSHLQSHED